MKIIYDYIPKEMWTRKCSFVRRAKKITIHERLSDTQAERVVEWLKHDLSAVGFNVVIDEEKAIVCIPLDRNSYACGDGAYGEGNKYSLNIELCRAQNKNPEIFEKVLNNLIEFLSDFIFPETGLNVSDLRQHYDWTGYNCPRRIRKENRWEEILERLKERGITI